MKKVILSYIISLSGLMAFAQPPVPAVTDTVSTQTSASTVDTTGALKQVPNNTSVKKNNVAVTDTSKVRYEKGGKASKDGAHTKRTPAKKDTPYSSSDKRKN